MTDKPSINKNQKAQPVGQKQAETPHAYVENAYENTTDFLPEIVVTDEIIEASKEVRR